MRGTVQGHRASAPSEVNKLTARLGDTYSPVLLQHPALHININTTSVQLQAFTLVAVYSQVQLWAGGRSSVTFRNTTSMYSSKRERNEVDTVFSYYTPAVSARAPNSVLLFATSLSVLFVDEVGMCDGSTDGAHPNSSCCYFAPPPSSLWLARWACATESAACFAASWMAWAILSCLGAIHGLTYCTRIHLMADRFGIIL